MTQIRFPLPPGTEELLGNQADIGKARLEHWRSMMVLRAGLAATIMSGRDMSPEEAHEGATAILLLEGLAVRDELTDE